MVYDLTNPNDRRQFVQKFDLHKSDIYHLSTIRQDDIEIGPYGPTIWFEVNGESFYININTTDVNYQNMAVADAVSDFLLNLLGIKNLTGWKAELSKAINKFVQETCQAFFSPQPPEPLSWEYMGIKLVIKAGFNSCLIEINDHIKIKCDNCNDFLNFNKGRRKKNLELEILVIAASLLYTKMKGE